MSNKFDLERFKKGEVAYSSYSENTYRYIGMDRDYVVCHVLYSSNSESYIAVLPSYMEKYFTMKPKEEWAVVRNMWGSTFGSFEAAERARNGNEDLVTVKIIRE